MNEWSIWEHQPALCLDTGPFLNCHPRTPGVTVAALLGATIWEPGGGGQLAFLCTGACTGPLARLRWAGACLWGSSWSLWRWLQISSFCLKVGVEGSGWTTLRVGLHAAGQAVSPALAQEGFSHPITCGRVAGPGHSPVPGALLWVSWSSALAGSHWSCLV